MNASPTPSATPMDPPAPSPSQGVRSRFTRRGVIGAAGAVVASAVLTPAVTADTPSGAAGPATPDAGTDAESGMSSETFPETRAQASTGEAPVRTAFPIGHVAVRWAGTRETTGGGIRLTGADGLKGSWQPLPDNGCSDSDGGALLIPVDQASGYELKAPDGATDLRSLAIDTTHGPKREVAVPRYVTRMGDVACLPRAAWGADEKLRFGPDGAERTPHRYHPFQALTVHHTATANGDEKPAATVRAIYHQHAVTNAWGDIGYHFLIDEKGQIYEGRHSGEGDTPAHDEEGRVVTAFHAGGFNSGNLGISLIGNLVDQGPTPAARDALTRLVQSMIRFHQVDPEARVTYSNPLSGTERDVDRISGHRDWMATACPGGTMYGELAALRNAVAADG